MKLSRKALLVSVGAIATTSVGYAVLMRPTHPTTLKEVEAALSRSLRRGQARSEVEAYLRQEAIPFSYVAGTMDALRRDSSVCEMGVPLSIIGGYIMAIINDTHRELLSSESISLRFLFDHNDRLLAWRTRAVYTGL